MSVIEIEPWVGNTYGTYAQRGNRILLMGEYCYGRQGSADKRDRTKKAIQAFLDYKKGAHTFENWMRAFVRFSDQFPYNAIKPIICDTFWNSILYYNYIQEILKGSGSVPSSKMYADSKDAFIEVLKTHTPGIIIVLGKRLWDKLPDKKYYASKTVKYFGGWEEKAAYLECGGQNIPAYPLYSPTSSWLQKDQFGYLVDFIRKM